MKQAGNFHLSEDEIIRVVVEVADAPPEFLHHLDTCPTCRAQKERLESNLLKLGDFARLGTPKPPRIEIRPTERIGSGWLPLWIPTAVMIAALAVVVFWSGILPYGEPEIPIAVIERQMIEDAQLMAEIEYLEENPLPEALKDISDSNSSSFDEDFIQFLVPASQTDTRVSG